MDLKSVFVFFAILLVFSGCLSQNNSGQQDQNIQTQNSPVDVEQEEEEESNLDTPNEAVNPNTGFACSDIDIVNSIEGSLGAGYTVTQGAAVFGKTFNAANCFVKKDGVSFATYSVLSQLSEEKAVEVIEDEKKQYQQQLFEYNMNSLPAPGGYFFEQPVADGYLYRIVFIDSTNKTVVIFVKTNSVVDKGTVQKIADAI